MMNFEELVIKLKNENPNLSDGLIQSIKNQMLLDKIKLFDDNTIIETLESNDIKLSDNDKQSIIDSVNRIRNEIIPWKLEVFDLDSSFKNYGQGCCSFIFIDYSKKSYRTVGLGLENYEDSDKIGNLILNMFII